MATQTAIATAIDPDQELIPFLSTKLTDYLSSWMGSNYFDLLSNYKAIFTAYNELKSDYDDVKKENKWKEDQIKKLQNEIKSTSEQYKKEILECKKMIESQLNEFVNFKQSISAQITNKNTNNNEKYESPEEQRLSHMNLSENDNEFINKLKNEIKMLQNEIIDTKNKLKESKTISNKTNKTLQIERKSFWNEIRNLKQQNTDYQFKLNAMQKESDFNIKCKEMNYQQTQQKYQELMQNHTNNIKSVYLFLNRLDVRCQRFLNKYSMNNNNNNDDEDDNDNNNDNDNDENKNDENMDYLSMRNVEPKLMTTYAKMEQFLYNVSMLMLAKDSDHLNNHNINDMDLIISDTDI